MNTRSLIGVLALWKLFALLVAQVGVFVLPLDYTMTAFRDVSFDTVGLNLPYLIKVWGNLDGFHYLSIANRGYYTGDVPFLPMYPLVVRAIHELTSLPFLLAGQLVSLVALFFALVVTIKLIKLDGFARLTRRAIMLILLFPTSFYYGATYNDSLFFLFATTTLYFARRKRWVMASFLAFFATLTRLNGLALFLFLIIEYLTADTTASKSWSWSLLTTRIRSAIKTRAFLRWEVVAFLLVPAALFSYLLYLQHTFNHWDLLFTAMKPWGQDKFVFPLQVVWRYIKILILYPTPLFLNWWVALIEVLFVAWYVLLLVTSYKKIRLSYWVFFLASILIPWSTGTFQGMPRYGLHLYPLFLALLLWYGRQASVARVIIIGAMLLLSIVGIILFTRAFFFA